MAGWSVIPSRQTQNECMFIPHFLPRRILRLSWERQTPDWRFFENNTFLYRLESALLMMGKDLRRFLIEMCID
jgi:hypothetical protein